VLWFFWNFELMKFCQNFGETFGEAFGKFWESFVAPSSPPKKHVRNSIYCTVQNLLFAEIVIIPLDILSSADLSYFNLGMFNFVQVMWNFRKISGEILKKLSQESFVNKIQTFVPKVSGNFCVKFWRKFPCCNTSYTPPPPQRAKGIGLHFC